MNLLYPFREVEEALFIMYSYVGYAGIVFELRCHEVLDSGQRVIEYRACFTKSDTGPSLLTEAGEWANPLAEDQVVTYLWRFEVPNAEAEVLAALNKLYKLSEQHHVTDEEPKRRR